MPPTSTARSEHASAWLQVHAPLQQPLLHDRYVYVFGCVRGDCALRPGSWKAWRCQSPPADPPAADPGAPPTQEGSAPAASAPAAAGPAAVDLDGWGASGEAADEWGLAAAGGDPSPSFDLSGLADAIEAAGAQRNARPVGAAAHATGQQQGQGEPTDGAQPGLVWASAAATGSELPAFYVDFTPEPAGESA